MQEMQLTQHIQGAWMGEREDQREVIRVMMVSRKEVKRGRNAKHRGFLHSGKREGDKRRC